LWAVSNPATPRHAKAALRRLRARPPKATGRHMFTIYPTNPDSQGCKPFWSPGEFSPLPLKARQASPCERATGPVSVGLSPPAACHLLAAPPYVHGACPRPAASPEQLDNQTGRLELLPSAVRANPTVRYFPLGAIYRRNRYFARNELSRLCLGVLRNGDERVAEHG
jgi:hypothetical protein